jgi:hypothetical protein
MNTVQCRGGGRHGSGRALGQGSDVSCLFNAKEKAAAGRAEKIFLNFFSHQFFHIFRILKGFFQIFLHFHGRIFQDFESQFHTRLASSNPSYQPPHTSLQQPAASACAF